MPTYDDIGTNYGEIGTNYGEIGTNYGEIGTSYGEIGTSYGEIGTTSGEIGTRIYTYILYRASIALSASLFFTQDVASHVLQPLYTSRRPLKKNCNRMYFSLVRLDVR